MAMLGEWATCVPGGSPTGVTCPSLPVPQAWLHDLHKATQKADPQMEFPEPVLKPSCRTDFLNNVILSNRNNSFA